MIDTEQKQQDELTWLLQRVAPARIPRSGTAAQAVDCYSIEVPRNGEPYLMLNSIHGSSVEALEWDGARFATQRQMPLSAFTPEEFEITHFYGLDELRFRGLNQAARARRWRLPYIELGFLRYKRAVAQWLFNRRDLKAGERLEVLRDVVDAVSNSGQDAVDAFFLMTRRHRDQWARHPAWEQHHRSLNGQLRGLVDTGELRIVGEGALFSPTGLAFRTLEESDDTDRKHRDNFRLQLAIGILTLVGAFMGAVQANVVKLPTLVDFTRHPEAVSCTDKKR